MVEETKGEFKWILSVYFLTFFHTCLVHRTNYVHLNMFFEELNYEKVEQVAAYDWLSLVSKFKLSFPAPDATVLAVLKQNQFCVCSLEILRLTTLRSALILSTQCTHAENCPLQTHTVQLLFGHKPTPLNPKQPVCTGVLSSPYDTFLFWISLCYTKTSWC